MRRQSRPVPPDRVPANADAGTEHRQPMVWNDEGRAWVDPRGCGTAPYANERCLQNVLALVNVAGQPWIAQHSTLPSAKRGSGTPSSFGMFLGVCARAPRWLSADK